MWLRGDDGRPLEGSSAEHPGEICILDLFNERRCPCAEEFEGQNVIEICAQHVESAPEPPSSRLGRPIAPEERIPRSGAICGRKR